MPEFKPITTVEDVLLQDEGEMRAGYKAGLRGDREPGSDKSRAYWHGWRNGMVDGRHWKHPDPDQQQLAKEHQQYQRRH